MKEAPIDKIIVADSSPLIVLARIDHLFILENLFQKIIIPNAVAKECLFEDFRPGARNIQASILGKKIEVFKGQISFQSEINIPSILGEGESAAICLAKQLDSAMIIDDLWGRKIAEKLQIPIIGTAGLLLLAKKNRIIKEIKPIIIQLQENNFHISQQLLQKLLLLGNEINAAKN